MNAPTVLNVILYFSCKNPSCTNPTKNYERDGEMFNKGEETGDGAPCCWNCDEILHLVAVDVA